MNTKCYYCDSEGMCVLENCLCTSDYGVCNLDITKKKAKPNAHEEYVVYFYDSNGAYIYCIKCWCTQVNELLDLIDDEHNDYTYEIRKVQE